MSKHVLPTAPSPTTTHLQSTPSQPKLIRTSVHAPHPRSRFKPDSASSYLRGVVLLCCHSVPFMLDVGFLVSLFCARRKPNGVNSGCWLREVVVLDRGNNHSPHLSVSKGYSASTPKITRALHVRRSLVPLTRNLFPLPRYSQSATTMAVHKQFGLSSAQSDLGPKAKAGRAAQHTASDAQGKQSV